MSLRLDLKLLISICLLIVAAAPTTTNSYRILGLFPHPGVSHFHFFHPIMRELAAAGHNVTVISHFPDAKAPKNYKDLPLTGMDTLTNAVDLDVSMRCLISIEFNMIQSKGHFKYIEILCRKCQSLAGQKGTDLIFRFYPVV